MKLVCLIGRRRPSVLSGKSNRDGMVITKRVETDWPNVFNNNTHTHKTNVDSNLATMKTPVEKLSCEHIIFYAKDFLLLSNITALHDARRIVIIVQGRSHACVSHCIQHDKINDKHEDCCQRPNDHRRYHFEREFDTAPVEHGRDHANQNRKTIQGRLLRNGWKGWSGLLRRRDRVIYRRHFHRIRSYTCVNLGRRRCRWRRHRRSQ